MASPAVDYDVLIVGAGISGITAAYRLQTELPDLTFTILEGRATLGGTWDFFRYPGIRSDSDLFTFCFPWHAWDQAYPIAEGATILQYIQQAASKHGIDRRIKFQHRVTRASWSSSDQVWHLTVESPEDTSIYRSRFLILGTGFYNYSQALKTEIPGLQQFQGTVVHPQFWPDGLDYRDQKIVVIGSGATAITMIPKLAEKAAHTTMLQRSPTYIVSMPNRQIPSVSSWLARWLPRPRFYWVQRFLSLVYTRLFILFCERWPHLARAYLRSHVRRQLPPAVAYDPHFAPLYAPMEQRLCVSPDADFFRSLHTGHVGVVTDTIETCTATGIQLRSGQHLDADLIITATGLQMQFAGGALLDIDGVPVDLSSKFIWNGMMLQDVPNAVVVNGYTNASWTLGADATMIAICRLIQLLHARGHTVAVPRVDPQGPPLTPRPTFALTSTYIHAAARFMPRVAAEKPWQRRDNYFTDLWFAKYGDLEQGLDFIPGSGFSRATTGGGEKPKEVKRD